jgi:hypothetical protein
VRLTEVAAAFYRHLGYGTDDVVSMGKRLRDDAAPGQPPNSAATMTYRQPADLHGPRGMRLRE